MIPVRQLLRFIVTGLTSLAADFLVLRLLLSADVGLIVAVALAFLVGVGVNLFMHKFFTFRESSRLHGQQVARYFAVVGVNLLLTEAVIWLVIEQAGLSPLQGKLLCLPLVFLVSYALLRHWVFVDGSQRH